MLHQNQNPAVSRPAGFFIGISRLFGSFPFQLCAGLRRSFQVFLGFFRANATRNATRKPFFSTIILSCRNATQKSPPEGGLKEGL